jgi:hypothetical protein
MSNKKQEQTIEWLHVGQIALDGLERQAHEVSSEGTNFACTFIK